MTGKELRRLSRRELLEILIEQQRENDQLRMQIESVQQQLESRDIVYQNAGTLAEAALKINAVFEAADRAAKQYIENLKRSNDLQMEAYNAIVADAKEKASMIINEAEKVKRAGGIR